MRANPFHIIAFCVLITIIPGVCYALPRVAVLAFELNDITSLPNTPMERSRTASFQALLENAFEQSGKYELIRINAKDQRQANASLGYLFRFPYEAAKLGKKFGANWIIVGQHSKPSFLESSLIVDVVNVNKNAIAAEFYIDLKGNHKNVTMRAILKLFTKINNSLSSNHNPKY